MTHVEPALLSMADRLAQQLRVGTQPIDADELIAKAEEREGRRFRNRDFEPALRVLIEACEQEADLSVFGRFSTKWDIVRLLRNILCFDAAEEANADIARADVVSPIFITGLPRSGTTFLHMLLAHDPENRIPLSFQTIQPYPDERDRSRDRRVQRVERQFKAFRRIAPDLGNLHPLAALTPQECTEITAHVFQSLRFDNTYFIPSYLKWLEKNGHADAFAFHKRFLQHLQAQRGGRNWILKCPDHVFTLEAIVDAYPDARFIFVHRDPTEVLPSVAKLTEVLRAPFSRRVDKIQVGSEVAQRWEEGAGKIIAATTVLPQERVMHLHYRQLTADPIGTLEGLYSYFDMPFSEVARDRISEFLQHRPRGGYGVNRYDPAEFGYELSRLRQRFEHYIRAFAHLAPRAAAPAGGALA